MSHADSKSIEQQVRKAPGLWWFFPLVLILLFLFLGVNAWLTRWSAGNAEPEEIQRAEFRTQTLADLRTEESQKLDTYAWVDRAKGTVQIPITEAMKLVLQEINNSRPRAAYPVATPAPAAPTPNGP